MRIIYLGLGWVMVALGVIGLVVPLMPGAVFLIVALWCFARSSPRFEAWLLDHPTLGRPLRDWRAAGAIPRPAKAMAMGRGTWALRVDTRGLSGRGRPTTRRSCSASWHHPTNRRRCTFPRATT